MIITRAIENTINSITSNKDFIERGKSLVLDNNLEFQSFKSFKIDDISFYNFDFKSDSFKDRTWLWKLNSLSFISYIIAYCNFNHDYSYLYIAKDAIICWIDNVFTSNDDFEFLWHDHTTALRTEQIILFLSFAYLNNLQLLKNSNYDIKKILHVIEDSCHKLADENSYTKHTNHGLEQQRVLLLASTVLVDRIPSIAKYKELALTRILDEFNFSFTDESVHKENSPVYHIFVSKIFITLFNDYELYFQNIKSQFMQHLKNGCEFISYMVRPDGNLPILGDSELLRPTDIYYQVLNGTEQYKMFRFAISKGREYKDIQNKFLDYKVYPKSGYAILKNKDNHLILKAGSLSSYHYHQDEGSITLYSFNEDWFIDSGMYSHNQTDPLRKYCRSFRAHNVAYVSNSSYSVNLEDRFTKWTLIDQENLIKFECSFFTNHTWSRSISKNLNEFFINDQFEFTDLNIENQITLQFHVPNDKSIYVDDSNVNIGSKDKLLNLSFSTKPSSIIVKKGKVKDRLFSFVSNERFKIDESYVILILFKNLKKKFNVTTFFNFQIKTH